METIRQIAFVCVARAVGFGTLAIGCVMLSFAFSPPTAFRAGALLALIMAGVLILKAHHAVRQQPKHTEVWLYLEDGLRPRDAEAKRRFAGVLRDTYGRFAAGSLAAACCMFFISVVLVATGMEMASLGPIIR
jgi:hypothetical protein